MSISILLAEKIAQLFLILLMGYIYLGFRYKKGI